MIDFKRFENYFSPIPYRVELSDSEGRQYCFGDSSSNGSDNGAVRVISHEKRSDDSISRLAARQILEDYVEGRIDIEGDFRYFAQLRLYVEEPGKMLTWRDKLDYLVHNLIASNPVTERLAVRHHYDQPIDFVEGYLDTVVRAHACCVFGDPLSDPSESMVSLEDAAVNRDRLVAQKLQPLGKRVLDIGCGSGHLVNLVVKEFGAREAYGVTLSENQKQDADRLFAASGTASRCRVDLMNYRDLEGEFDCINSVGMVSHIGAGMLGYYWSKVKSLLKPGGLYHHHCFMDYDSRFQEKDCLPLFSRKWVWPNYHWYRLDEHIKAAEENRFEIQDIKCLRLHYARTIDHWYQRYIQNIEEKQYEHVSEEITRAWRAYLANMAIGFRNREFTVNQLLCKRLESRIVPVVINLSESRPRVETSSRA